LLSDIYKLANDAEYRGDTEAIVLRVDLERALKSMCMSPKQRQAVALYYFTQLTQEECAKVLNVTQQAIAARLDDAVHNIAMHMRGEDVSVPQYIRHDDYTNIDDEFDMWMAQVLVGYDDWWVINDNVISVLNRVLGMPKVDAEQQSGDGDREYPYYTDKQMKRKFSREVPRPDVYPVFDNMGYRIDEKGDQIPLLHMERYT
jgi:predicted DNA-binding protein (UPF0251 family)